MDTTAVTSHYGSDALGERLLGALDVAFGGSLDATSLRGVDQFHLGGHRATEAMLDSLDLGSTDHVLDVGCGIGGVARDLHARFGSAVTAIDLTPEFIDAARALSEKVGAGDGITFEVGDALDMPYPDRHFSGAVVVHVGMNIASKEQLFAELHRVVGPAAPVVVYDIVRRTDAPLSYPLPWASSAAIDFVDHQGAYEDAIRSAGLTLGGSVDRSDLVADAIERAAADPPRVSLADLMGSGWPTMFGNLVSALEAGTLAPVQMTAHR